MGILYDYDLHLVEQQLKSDMSFEEKCVLLRTIIEDDYVEIGYKIEVIKKLRAITYKTNCMPYDILMADCRFRNKMEEYCKELDELLENGVFTSLPIGFSLTHK